MTPNTNQQQDVPLPLERIYATSSARILDFLLLNRNFDYSEGDISKLARVPYRTLQRVFPRLLEEGLIKQTRKSGRSSMYMANTDSKRVQALLQYAKATMEENLQKTERIIAQ